ncbi:hypothetical protein BS614_26240 [Paenibacillus xylanexedens]|uniref:non-ribosomal peptide synthetase n=1 Tax=Paenibacillus xylanexedens TaxID=528191 RepID=UPI0009381E48|nr:non-ribosomal peptide synthetase [Paenibacillus xylanexedens]APO47206.1 hypothetical protein BS614_26240 [Paenibacillus xylanexedens]
MVVEQKKVPLSHPQKRIWYIEKIYPNHSLHNIGGIVWIKGWVDVAILEKAINIFIEKHSGLRVKITENEDKVFQEFEAYKQIPLTMLDFSNYDLSENKVKEWATSQFTKPFKLLDQQLYEFIIVKTSDERFGYFVKIHHIVCDGWSIQIMTEEINQIYNKLIHEENVEIQNNNGYEDFIIKEQRYVSSKRFEKNKLFWMNKFKTLPDNYLEAKTTELCGTRKSFWIDRSLTNKIKSYLQTNTSSINTFFLSMILIYQHKLTQKSDLIIGTPLLNRSGAIEKKIIGMFTSTLAFRTSMEGSELITSFIKRVNKELKECYYHQRYPYDLLIQELELRKRGYDQLLQISVNYYNTKLNNYWNDFSMEYEELYCGEQLNSLQFIIKEWDSTGRLEIVIDYLTGDYTDEDIENMFQRLILLIEQVLNPFDVSTIGDLRITSKQERYLLTQKWNSTEVEYLGDKLVYSLIEERAISTPNKIAAICGNEQMTYASMIDYVNMLAAKLQNEGVRKGNIVALLITHSFETLISILAVMKVGATYLPLDLAYPAKRIKYILEDSQVSLVLTNVDFPCGIKFDGKIMFVNRLTLERVDSSPNLEPIYISLEDPVYIIYTSGSTGNPKGVVINHRGLLNYTLWAGKTYYTKENDVSALYSSLAFDLTITAIFPPLINGQSILIYPASEDEFIIRKILADNIVTVLKLTPAHLSMIRTRENTESSVRTLVVGGEDLKAAIAMEIYNSFGRRVTLINEYGPTETVVGCITHQFDPEVDHQGSVPIGRPIANTQVYLLDDNMQLVPRGQVGELYIAGDGVAIGYLGQSEMTENRFVFNRFSVNKGMMYKTDDLVFWRPDGKLEYVGRKDSQIKLNGYRIEMGEIENQLLRVDGVSEAVVIACCDENNKSALAAYLVYQREDLTSFEVREALLEIMPAFMIPQYLVFMNALPVTVNGKIDRGALPLPQTAVNNRLPMSNDALDKRKKIVLKVMSEVLQSEGISLRDNFYSLGGDSIKAIQVKTLLNIEGFQLQVSDVLSFPVIGELVYALKEENSKRAIREPSKGYVKLTPIIDYFIKSNFQNPHYYNQSILLNLKITFSFEHILNAFKQLIQLHDTLLLRFDKSNSKLRYFSNFSDQPELLEVISLDNCAPYDIERVVLEQSLICKQSLHIERGPLFKGVLFQRHIGEDLLLLTAHHLIVDAVSWRILLEDLDHLIKSSAGVQKAPTLLTSDSYRNWSEALSGYHDEIEHETIYWSNMLQDQQAPLNFDLRCETLKVGDTETIHAELDVEVTKELFTSANRAYNTRPNEILVAALAVTCHAMSGKRSFVIEMESHGREAVFPDLDISRTVGWFTSMYPLRLVVPEADLGKQIKSIKEDLRSVPNHGIGYGALVLANKLPTFTEKTIRFNYLGEIDDRMEKTNFELSTLNTGKDQAEENEFDAMLEIIVLVKNKQLCVAVTFSRKVFYIESVERFVREYIINLQQMVNHCLGMEEPQFSPSDFDLVSLTQGDLDQLFT